MAYTAVGCIAVHFVQLSPPNAEPDQRTPEQRGKGKRDDQLVPYRHPNEAAEELDLAQGAVLGKDEPV